MKKENEKMKILDDTIHILKISHSQKTNITSPHSKTCWRDELFRFFSNGKEKNIKMTSFLKAKRPSEAFTALRPAAANTPYSFKHKRILKNTQRKKPPVKDAKNLITPNPYTNQDG
ncbi:hypothetical protein AVEN_37543-1 [Araneus ventricosus]|uniref:Uncharacterized protein n=1 Tax=Araneus ventricosus TaxID=182803 RepID=A0A4Y2RT61_ARAVE|nr:hypothetical protein AVEN_37543-1 [Araneus ventricosus]